MEDSVFTKIIKDEIPCHKVYEDEKTLAFMDIHPAQKGQVVVVPKLQVSYVWDLPVEDYTALMAAVQKVGQRLREIFTDKERIGVRIEGFDTNNHAHVVLIPANNSSEFNTLADMGADPDHQSLAELAERLRF